MNRRLLVVLALVAAVTLAGCSWVAPAQTPTPTPDDASSATMIPVFRIDNHANALANRSYALTIDVRAAEADARTNRTITVRSNLDTHRLLVHNSVKNRSVSRYVNATMVFTRAARNGTVNYTVQSLSTLGVNFSVMHRKAIQSGRLQKIYQVGSFEQTDNVTENGRQYTEFTLSNTSLASNLTVTHANGSVRIGRNGVIYHAFVDLRGHRTESPFRLNMDYRTRTRNVSVTPPDWLDTAVAATSENETATETGSG
ncbi:MAG: hypothetical protein ABEI77_10725 [Halorientalis sp.]